MSLITAFLAPSTLPTNPQIEIEENPTTYSALKDTVTELFNANLNQETTLALLSPLTLKDRSYSTEINRGDLPQDHESLEKRLATLAERSDLCDEDLFILLNHIATTSQAHEHNLDLIENLWKSTFIKDEEEIDNSRLDHIAIKTLTLLLKDALNKDEIDLSPFTQLLDILNGSGILLKRDPDQWINSALNSISSELTDEQLDTFFSSFEVDPSTKNPLSIILQQRAKEFISTEESLKRAHHNNISSIRGAIEKCNRLAFATPSLWEKIFDIVDRCRWPELKRSVALKWYEKSDKQENIKYSFNCWKRFLIYLGEEATTSTGNDETIDFKKLYLSKNFHAALDALENAGRKDDLAKLHNKCFRIASKNKPNYALMIELANSIEKHPSIVDEQEFFEATIAPLVTSSSKTSEGVYSSLLILNAFPPEKMTQKVFSTFLEVISKLATDEDDGFKRLSKELVIHLFHTLNTHPNFPHLDFAETIARIPINKFADCAILSLNEAIAYLSKHSRSMKKPQIDLFLKRYETVLETALAKCSFKTFKLFKNYNFHQAIKTYTDHQIPASKLYETVCLKEISLAKINPKLGSSSTALENWNQFSDDTTATDKVGRNLIDLLLTPEPPPDTTSEKFTEATFQLTKKIIPKVLLSHVGKNLVPTPSPLLKYLIDSLGELLKVNAPSSYIYGRTLLAVFDNENYRYLSMEYGYADGVNQPLIELANKSIEPLSDSDEKEKISFLQELQSHLFSDSFIPTLEKYKENTIFVKELNQYLSEAVKQQTILTKQSLEIQMDLNPINLDSILQIEESLKKSIQLCRAASTLSYIDPDTKNKAWNASFSLLTDYATKILVTPQLKEIPTISKFVNKSFHAITTFMDVSIRNEFVNALCTTAHDEIDKSQLFSPYALYEKPIDTLLALNNIYPDALPFTIDGLMNMSLSFIRYQVTDQHKKEARAKQIIDLLSSRYYDLKKKKEYKEFTKIIIKATQDEGLEDTFQYYGGPSITDFNYLQLKQPDGTRVFQIDNFPKTTIKDHQAIEFLKDHAIETNNPLAILFAADLILQQRNYLITTDRSSLPYLDPLRDILDCTLDKVPSKKDKHELFDIFYGLVNRPISKYLKHHKLQTNHQPGCKECLSKERLLHYLTGSEDKLIQLHFQKFLGRIVRTAILNHRELVHTDEKRAFMTPLLCFVNLCVLHDIPRSFEEMKEDEIVKDTCDKMRIELKKSLPSSYEKSIDNILRLMIQ